MKQIILEDRERVINLVAAKVTKEFIRYGLELETFNILGLTTTEDAQELLDKEKDKTKAITKAYKSELENQVLQKTELQNRIKELNEKKNDLQNLLLNDKITQKEYENKKEQIKIFMKEVQEDLKKIDKTISRI